MEKLLKPTEFIINSFFTGHSINPSLITNIGEKNIEKLIEYLIESIENKFYDERKKKQIKQKINKALTMNQLRKFYDSFLKIYNNKKDEKEKKIQLLMLKANAEYSAKRLDTHRFKIFLANRINTVISKEGSDFQKNLDALKLHLEALVAYYPKN